MSNTKSLGVGIIGAGHISAAYLKAIPNFPILDVVGIADLKKEAARGRADEFGIAAMSVDDLLSDPKVDIVLNLTIPQAHMEIGLRALAAEKHVYAEKPLAVSFADGQRLWKEAQAKGLRLGSAPDTFLGGGQQLARAVVDSGKLGPVVGGSAYFACPGHEYWHASPAFYYDLGGGPVLDMGPYYITALVNLLGPISKVMAVSTTPRRERPILSEARRGEMMPVRVATHVTGTLVFTSGALVTVTLSFDVPKHGHTPIEIYGTQAALLVPDPNKFGGSVQLAAPRAPEWETIESSDEAYADGNYRSLGLADMAYAIANDRPHRASGDLALHVLEVMEAFDRSSETGAFVEMATTVVRPAPLREDLLGSGSSSRLSQ